MVRPKACTCGGSYKKVASPPNARDGSRYFRCDKCAATIEQTSNGYEFKDAGPPPAPKPAPAPVAPAAPVRRSFWA